MFGLGIGEIVIVLAIILLFFGGKKLPELGSAMGKALNNFKSGLNESKKPKIDFIKYVDNDKKILRYTARFNTKVPEDVDRRFIISFYLADDTISIYEPSQKNSGIEPGAFLERRKYKNVDKMMEFITPTDMPVGGDIKINGYNFHVLDCDEYTTKYLATHTYE